MAGSSRTQEYPTNCTKCAVWRALCVHIHTQSRIKSVLLKYVFALLLMGFCWHCQAIVTVVVVVINKFCSSLGSCVCFLRCVVQFLFYVRYALNYALLNFQFQL